MWAHALKRRAGKKKVRAQDGYSQTGEWGCGELREKEQEHFKETIKILKYMKDITTLPSNSKASSPPSQIHQWGTEG